MFKFVILAFVALFAVVFADPEPQFLAYSAPLVAAPALASSAVVSREFHGNTAPLVAAYPYAYSAPYVVSPYAASTVLV